MLCQQKTILHRSYVDQNYQSYRLKLCESQKNMWHQKKKLMLTKYVHCCTEKKYMLTKKVHAVYKYMLHWLKKIMSHEKYFDVVQKLKLVCINVINIFQNGAPYTCVSKNSIVSKDLVFYLLWYNMIRWSSHICKKSSFLSFYIFLVKFSE